MRGYDFTEDTSPLYLSTRAAQRRLSDRGVLIDRGTILKWCAQGKFVGAQRAGKGKRSPWVIPTASIDTTPASGDARIEDRARKELFWGNSVALDRKYDEERAQAEKHVYQQPWARAYLTAVRDGDVLEACARAGVAEETILAEIRENEPFADRVKNLWDRRYDLDDVTPKPHPIATLQQIEAEIARLSADARSIFDQASANNYLVVSRVIPEGPELRHQWYRWCQTHGLPFICHIREDRWHVWLELDVYTLYEADGTPRRLPDALLAELPHLARRHTGYWDPSRVGDPSTILWSGFPVENADGVAAELYALYRKYFLDDPSPNPEVSGRVPSLPVSAYPLAQHQDKALHVMMAQFYSTQRDRPIAYPEPRYQLDLPGNLPGEIDLVTRDPDAIANTFVHHSLRSAYKHAALGLNILSPAGGARFNDNNAVLALVGIDGVGLSTLGRMLDQGLRAHTRQANLPLTLPVVRVELKRATGKDRVYRAYGEPVARAMRDAFIRQGIERSHPLFGDLRELLDRIIADLNRGAIINHYRLLRGTTYALKRVGVPVVIVDDVDVWAEDPKSAARTLRDVIRESETPHLLLANLRALPVVQSFDKRVPIVRFPPYDLDDPEDAQAFAGAFQRIRERSSLPFRSSTPESVEFYHERTSGCVGTLVRWIASAIALANARGADAVDTVDLEQTSPSDAVRRQRSEDISSLRTLVGVPFE